MKRIIILIFCLHLINAAMGQGRPTLPLDTFPVPTNLTAYTFVVSKNDTLWTWSVSQKKWVRGSSGISGPMSFTDNVLTLGGLTAAWDSTKYHSMGFYDGRYAPISLKSFYDQDGQIDDPVRNVYVEDGKIIYRDSAFNNYLEYRFLLNDGLRINSYVTNDSYTKDGEFLFEPGRAYWYVNDYDKDRGTKISLTDSAIISEGYIGSNRAVSLFKTRVQVEELAGNRRFVTSDAFGFLEAKDTLNLDVPFFLYGKTHGTYWGHTRIGYDGGMALDMESISPYTLHRNNVGLSSFRNYFKNSYNSDSSYAVMLSEADSAYSKVLLEAKNKAGEKRGIDLRGEKLAFIGLATDNTAPQLQAKDANGNSVWRDVSSISSSIDYPGAGIPVSTGSAWGTSITDNSTNWNTAYTDRLKWDGGSTDLNAATGRTSLGGTTVGQNLFTLTNPSAITFPRINADNTVSALSATDFRTAISAMSNPMTTAGDLIIGGSGGTPTRLAIGGNGTVLGVQSGTYSWLTGTPWTGVFASGSYVTGSATLSTTPYNVYTGTGDATFTLPALSSNPTRSYIIKNASAAGNLTIARAGSDQLWTNGAVTSIQLLPGESIMVEAGSAYWYTNFLSSANNSYLVNLGSGDSAAVNLGDTIGLKSFTTTDFDATATEIQIDATLKSTWNGKQAGIQYKDEGTNLGTSATVTEINFTGSGVTATRTGNAVTVDIAGGGGGGGDFYSLTRTETNKDTLNFSLADLITAGYTSFRVRFDILKPANDDVEFLMSASSTSTFAYTGFTYNVVGGTSGTGNKLAIAVGGDSGDNSPGWVDIFYTGSASYRFNAMAQFTVAHGFNSSIFSVQSGVRSDAAMNFNAVQFKFNSGNIANVKATLIAYK